VKLYIPKDNRNSPGLDLSWRLALLHLLEPGPSPVEPSFLARALHSSAMFCREEESVLLILISPEEECKVR